jgi:hypothetical protein
MDGTFAKVPFARARTMAGLLAHAQMCASLRAGVRPRACAGRVHFCTGGQADRRRRRFARSDGCVRPCNEPCSAATCRAALQRAVQRGNMPCSVATCRAALQRAVQRGSMPCNVAACRATWQHAEQRCNMPNSVATCRATWQHAVQRRFARGTQGALDKLTTEAPTPPPPSPTPSLPYPIRSPPICSLCAVGGAFCAAALSRAP